MAKKKLPYYHGHRPVIALGVIKAIARAEPNHPAPVELLAKFFELAQLLAFQDERFCRMVQEVRPNEVLCVSRRTEDYIGAIADYMKQHDLRTKFKELMQLLLENNLDLDYAITEELKKCIKVSWPLTHELLVSFPKYLSSQPDAKLVLRIKYIHTIYQHARNWDKQVKALRSTIAKMNVEHAGLQMRMKQCSLAERLDLEPRYKELDKELSELIQLRKGYELLQAASEMSTDSKSWVRGLRNFIEYSRAYRGVANPETRVTDTIELLPKAIESQELDLLLSSTYIYQLLDEMEEEDQRLYDCGYLA